jgi:DNA transformation protein and related proteins
MTTPSAEYIEYILEHLQPISSLQTSRFFGGLGVSNGFVQFAMMMGNSLYFVVDDGSRKKYEQAGMQAFSYMTKKGCIQVRRYYEVPEEVLTDSEPRNQARQSRKGFDMFSPMLNFTRITDQQKCYVKDYIEGQRKRACLLG